MPTQIEVEDFKKAGSSNGVKVENDESNGSVSDIARKYWQSQWALQSAQNYPIIARSHGVQFLQGACKGIPAFVVGIGPSLDKNIAELKQAQGRAIVIATDAATRPLLANGIRPDLVITYDCKSAQPTLWDRIVGGEIIPLIANSCCHPGVISSWSGPILFYNQWHKKDDFTEKCLPAIYPHLGSMPSLGTVGSMGVFLASFMGCSPVATVGMDLCYQKGIDEDSYTYRCQDYEWKKDQMDIYDWRKTENKLLYNNDERVKRSHEKDYVGTTFRIDPELNAYVECLLGIAKALKLNIIDCSVDGVLKQYFDHMTVNDFILKHCNNELSEGRTVLRYLGEIAKDGRKLWAEESKNGSPF